MTTDARCPIDVISPEGFQHLFVVVVAAAVVDIVAPLHNVGE